MTGTMGVLTRQDFAYYDLRQRLRSADIATLFPGWQASQEHVVVLCPHDDDGVLGAGYLVLAALANGAEVHILIFCNGCGGYSAPEDKPTIVERRREESLQAYHALGLAEQSVIRFDYPDFSLLPNIGWIMPWGREGTIGNSLRVLRKLQPTRLVIPNGYREHLDHEATYRIGVHDGPQVSGYALADWGLAPPIKSHLVYTVGRDFTPEDALLTGSDLSLRGNRAVVAEKRVEEAVLSAINVFRSQARVIEDILQARRGRLHGSKVIEVYQALDPRPHLDYGPYLTAVEEIDAQARQA